MCVLCVCVCVVCLPLVLLVFDGKIPISNGLYVGEWEAGWLAFTWWVS